MTRPAEIRGPDARAAQVTILGFDTATAVATVAVASAGRLLFERDIDPGPGGRPRHATELLAAIDVGVDAAGGWEEIGRLAVGAGPGSFTGLRVGVATARALAQALGKPVVAVSSLGAIGRAMGEHRGAGGRARLAVIDARRGEGFAALFDPAGRTIWGPLVASPEAIGERSAQLDPGPLAAGDGALRFRAQLEAAGAEVPEGDDPVHRISARQICRLAEDEVPVRPEEVEPVYLRRPDAELWRERVRNGTEDRA